MKNTRFAVIRNFLFGNTILLFLAISAAYAAPVVRSATAEDPFALVTTYQQFLADLGGGSDNGTGNSYNSGYRWINWDVVQNNQLVNGEIPPDFFNTTSPRGMVLSSACSNDRFELSALQGSGTPLRFGNINPNYASAFKNFIGDRLISINSGPCNYIDVDFYVPGTRIPATVKGFALVFTDVDTPFASGIRCFGVDGKPLSAEAFASPKTNGMSFLSVTYNGGERIAKVRIYGGNGVLGNTDVSNGGNLDVVAMDEIYYGEPRAIGQHSNDFDGDGTADLTVFRPSDGIWHVLQSGSNTYAAVKFGLSGDIPVDGDFDGDSRNDVAVFRPSNGTWYILKSTSYEVVNTNFGLSGDKPVVADYDRDGRSDIAVWRGGIYHILQSSNNQYKAIQWGLAGDVPAGAKQ